MLGVLIFLIFVFVIFLIISSNLNWGDGTSQPACSKTILA